MNKGVGIMKNWEDMNEDEKTKFCRSSSCPYYYAEIDDCMYDEEDVPKNLGNKCKQLMNK